MKMLLQHLSAFLLNNPELSQYHYPISQRVWEAEEHQGQNCWEHTDFQIPDKGFWASHLSANFALCRAFAYPKYISQVLSVSAQHPCNTGLNLDIQKEFGFWDCCLGLYSCCCIITITQQIQKFQNQIFRSALPVVKADYQYWFDSLTSARATCCSRATNKYPSREPVAVSVRHLTASLTGHPARVPEAALRAVSAHVASGRDAAGQMGIRPVLICLRIINPGQHGRKGYVQFLSQSRQVLPHKWTSLWMGNRKVRSASR